MARRRPRPAPQGEELDAIRAARIGGATMAVLAERFNRSRDAIRAAIGDDLARNLHVIGPEEREAILAAIEAGKTYVEISRLFGRSEMTVRHLCDRAGVKALRRHDEGMLRPPMPRDVWPDIRAMPPGRRDVVRLYRTVATRAAPEFYASWRAMAWMLAKADRTFNSLGEEAIAATDRRDARPLNGGRYPRHAAALDPCGASIAADCVEAAGRE